MTFEKKTPATKSEIDSGRRIALRNMLVAGCALYLPACGAESPSGSAQADAGKPKKATKAQAKYQATPNGDQKCAVCAQFEPPKACKLVEGEISSDGWCALFTPKTS